MRGDALSRQLRLLQLLETRNSGVEIEEAAAELGTGRRTVYRDFEVLQQVGLPLVAEQDGRRARWRIMEGYRHRLQLSLTWSEVLALSTGGRLMAGLTGTLFHEGAVSALEKIRATLPRELARRVDQVQSGVSTPRGGHDYAARGRFLQVLVEAIRERKAVELRYRSRTRGRGARWRTLEPYHLRVTEQGIYVIGRDPQADDFRTFLLDRIDDLRETEANFEPKADFEAESFLEASFAMWSGRPKKVRFQASPLVASLLVERKVHPSQIVQRTNDGGAAVTMTVAIVPPLVSFLAGLGGEVREIEPAELAEAVREVHEAGLRTFAIGKTKGRGAGPP